MTAVVIMVDELRQWPHATGIFRAGSAHLTVNGTTPEHIEALHAFAESIGLKREWFQDHRLAPHYDLVESRRESALAAGAVSVDARTQAEGRIAAREPKITTATTAIGQLRGAGLERDVLHPTGKCKCAGEGHCEWCSTFAPCGHTQSACPGFDDGETEQPMKVLTVFCPWAQLIFFGKDVENRGLDLGWIGPVAIHASKGNHSPSECAEILVGLVARGTISIEVARQVADRIANDRGKVIGVVRITGARRTSKSPWWAEGQVAHELTDQRLLETPIPLVGKRGLLDYTLPACATFCPMPPKPQLELRALLDVDQAIAGWGANCGPAALAGALGLQLADVRGAVSDVAGFRGYMSISSMRKALRWLDAAIEQDWHRPPNGILAKTNGAPVLCCIMWGGPWSGDPQTAAKHRHFIVYRHGYVGSRGPGWVCDVNVEGGWCLASEWKAKTLPLLLPELGDGTWSIQWAAQVRPARGDR